MVPFVNNTAPNLIAIEHEFGGPHLVFDQVNTSEEAVWIARHLIKSGKADAMLVVVVDAAPTQLLPAGYRTRNGAVALFLTCDGKADLPMQIPAHAEGPLAALISAIQKA